MQKRQKEKYLEFLIKAAEWGMNDARDAWTRALDLVTQNPESFILEELLEEKAMIREEMKQSLEEWLESVLQQNPSPNLLRELEGSPEDVWQGMTYFNQGIFTLNDDPLAGFLTSLRSHKEGEMPQLLTPQPDGWGIPKAEE